MRRIVCAICLVSMLCFTSFLPMASALDFQQGIKELFGQARSSNEDIIVLYDGNVLRGMLLDEVIGICTQYSDMQIPLRKCAGISFSSNENDSVTTINYNRITGIVYTREFRFRESGTGNTAKIRRDKIKYIIVKQDLDEATSLGAFNVTEVLVMANGDILSGKPGQEDIWIMVDGSSVRIGFDEIESITMTTDSPLEVIVSKTDGKNLMGKLETEHIDLTLDIGIYIEEIFAHKLKEISMGNSFEQVAALYTNGGKIASKVAIAVISASIPAQDITLKIPGSPADLKMRLVPAGSFTMGSPPNEAERFGDEGPQHLVTISKPFYMGVYEVTQAQWSAVMGNNPSGFKGDDNPVSSVSWENCQKFIAELNGKGIGTFRLPTEAEWEYACRAGSTTRFPWGEDPQYASLGEYAWYSANSLNITHPAGQKKPNAWGLYDMHGNVFEWCSDWFGNYTSTSQTDPKGPETGSNRVVRGGSWNNSPRGCRSALRSLSTPTGTYDSIGFRLVRTVPQSLP